MVMTIKIRPTNVTVDTLVLEALTLPVPPDTQAHGCYHRVPHLCGQTGLHHAQEPEPQDEIRAATDEPCRGLQYNYAQNEVSMKSGEMG